MIDIDHLKSDTGQRMRPPPPALLPVFRSRLTGDLLALMMADPDRKWTAEELSSRTGAAYPTVTRELRRLYEARVVLHEAVGRSKLWRANDRNPHFQPLATLAVSSFGPPQVLAEQLADVPGIDEVFLFGSWAARAAGEPGPTPGDIDVLVLGSASRRDVNSAMRRAEERLGREVNAVVRTRDDWESADDGFARQVKSSPLFAVDGPWRPYDPEDASLEEGRSRDRTAPRATTPRARSRRH